MARHRCKIAVQAGAAIARVADQAQQPAEIAGRESRQQQWQQCQAEMQQAAIYAGPETRRRIRQRCVRKSTSQGCSSCGSATGSVDGSGFCASERPGRWVPQRRHRHTRPLANVAASPAQTDRRLPTSVAVSGGQGCGRDDDVWHSHATGPPLRQCLPPCGNALPDLGLAQALQLFIASSSATPTTIPPAA